MGEVVKGLSVEARLGNKTERANGTTTFPIQIAKDDFEAAKLLKPGRRYLIGFVEIDDNENLTPFRNGSSDTVTEYVEPNVRVTECALEDSPTSEHSTNTASLEKAPLAARGERPLPQIAGMLIMDRQFQMWCRYEFKWPPITPGGADRCLKKFCGIDPENGSKNEITLGSYAAKKFAEMRLAFRLWQNNNPGAELESAR